jgi:hypothetical protein
MKQKLAGTAVAMLTIGLLSVGVVSAHGPTDHPSGPPTGTLPEKAPTNPSIANHEVRFSARCTPASAGGSIKIQAMVVHGARGKTFSAVAVAPFTGGAATVNLRRAGKSYVAVGKIPVPAGQAAGPVVVSVTILYAGTPDVLTCTSQIQPTGAISSDID